MTGWMILLSNAAAAGVRSVIGLFLIYRLLSCHKPDKKSMAAVCVGMAAVIAMLAVLGSSELYRIIFETFLIVVCAVRFQAADLKMSLFLGVFYEIAVSFWQFLASAWMGVIFRCPAFLRYDTVNGQAAVWLLHFVLIVLAWNLMKYESADRQVKPEAGHNNKAFRSASIIVVAGFFFIVSLSEQTVLEFDDDTLNMWTVLAVVLMMSILVFNLNRQYEAEKELTRLKSEQAQLLEHDYTALNQAYALNAKLFHDFHNHIGVLRQHLLHGKTEQAMQYLDELQSPVKKMADTVWTGDETVDYLINSKAVTAKEYRINYQVQVEFPRHTNLKSADLCAVLGNLLDNALEAAEQVQLPEQRFVQLVIRRINQMLVIKVENSYVTVPIEKDGTFKTSKDENGLHGWGLKSAQTAAEKYDGTRQAAYTEHAFRAEATLSVVNVKPLDMD